MPDTVTTNVATGEQESRPMTAAETRQRDTDTAAADDAQLEADQRAAARAAAREQLRTATTVVALRDALNVLLP